MRDCWDCFGTAKAALSIYALTSWRRGGAKMGPGRRGPGRAFPDGIAELWAGPDSSLVRWLRHLDNVPDPGAHLEASVDWSAIKRLGGSAAFERALRKAALSALPNEHRPYDRVEAGPGAADARRFVAALTGLTDPQVRELAKPARERAQQ